MRSCFIVFLIFCAGGLFAQKLVIDSNTYHQWPSLADPIISNDGKYVVYGIENIPAGNRTLVLQSTNGKWRKEFMGADIYSIHISSNSKYALFKTSNDSLGIFTLGSDIIEYITNISMFRLQECKDGEWIYYFSTVQPQTLVLRNLKTKRVKQYKNVLNTHFSKNGNILILEKCIPGKSGMHSLNWLDVASDKIFTIWEGTKVNHVVLDDAHQQLAFMVENAIWHYKFGSAGSVCIANKNTQGIDNGLYLSGIDRFSKDGKRLFVLLKENDQPKPVKEIAEVWNSLDVKLKSERVTAPRTYFSVINLDGGKVVQLQQPYDFECSFPTAVNAPDKIALIGRKENEYEDWNPASKTTWSLISSETGIRTVLNIPDFLSISPFGKYLIYYSDEQQNYFSYEIATGQIRNLTKDIRTSWTDTEWSDGPGINAYQRGVAAWLANDEAVFIYDQYDIWKIDPLNKQQPINVTNEYGINHRVLFNFAMNSYSGIIIKKNQLLIFNSFNLNNKENGYYAKQLGKKGDPEQLVSGNYIFDIINPEYLPNNISFSPIKAKNANVYLLKRMSATEAPNYYSTNDFRTFKKLSDLQPEKKYNWYTTELHTWKSLDGRSLQGILYKPENFDPSKKYPIIFHYYQRKSNGLNAYIKPEVLCNGCNISIPVYVSQGYLVFTPDIYYKVGDPMQGTHDAIISAAAYIATLPYVNAKKMGIQGCSFGGLQTNYLITHTNLFAAAVSSSGIADLISGYGSLMGEGKGNKRSQQTFYETGQIRMGGTLWEKPNAYIKNSPIFQVDRVTTPLLIMHTKKDDISLYNNIMEFFTGLRRLRKKAWMLVYSDGNHGIVGNEANDFSIRMLQFFDYYLKDKTIPGWML